MRKEGISLLAMLVTVIILLILVTTIMVSYDAIKNSTLKKEFAHEIYAVQKLVDEYKFKYNKYPVKEIKNVSLTNVEQTSKEQFSTEPSFDTGIIELYELDAYEAGIESLARGVKKDGNENDIYVISQNTGKVYYLKGVVIDGKIYYALNDELKKEIGF